MEIERGEDGKYRGVLRKLDLTEHGRHAEEIWKAAQVVVEARRVSTGSYRRQILGSVVETQKKPITPIELAEFPDESEIVFRFKVVDPDKNSWGKLTAYGRANPPIPGGNL